MEHDHRGLTGSAPVRGDSDALLIVPAGRDGLAVIVQLEIIGLKKQFLLATIAVRRSNGSGEGSGVGHDRVTHRPRKKYDAPRPAR
jgi:hypothetical protein